MNAIINAVEAGHVTHYAGGEGQFDKPGPCKKDGEEWPCAAMRVARKSQRLKLEHERLAATKP